MKTLRLKLSITAINDAYISFFSRDIFFKSLRNPSPIILPFHGRVRGHNFYGFTRSVVCGAVPIYVKVHVPTERYKLNLLRMIWSEAVHIVSILSSDNFQAI